MPTLELTDKQFNTLMRAVNHYYESVNVKIDGQYVRPRKEPECTDAEELKHELGKVGK